MSIKAMSHAVCSIHGHCLHHYQVCVHCVQAPVVRRKRPQFDRPPYKTLGNQETRAIELYLELQGTDCIVSRIAERMGTRTGSISTALRRAQRKLGLYDRAALLEWARTREQSDARMPEVSSPTYMVTP